MNIETYMRPIHKIHKFFIDFYFAFVYDSIAKYGIPYFEENTLDNGISKTIL